MTHIQVVDRDGWERRFELTRRITRVGSAVGSDVVLNAARGAGVAATHVQLIRPASGACRMINLSGDDVRIGGMSPVPARGLVELRGGETIRLGEFTLTYVCDESEMPAAEQTSQAVPPTASITTATRSADGDWATANVSPETAGGANIGLEVALASTHIDPGQTIAGSVTVRNSGPSQAVQIQLDAEGLNGFCEVAPGPILFPGASRSVSLKLAVPEQSPLRAGRHRLVIRASAPQAYPGETAEATIDLEISPRYVHSLSWANHTDGETVHD